MTSDKCWKKYYSIIYFSTPYVFRNNNEKEKHISWNCVLLKTHFKSSRQLHIKVQLLTLHKLWPSAGGRLLLNVQMKKMLEGINQMASIFMINKWCTLHIIIFLQLKALCNEILSEMIQKKQKMSHISIKHMYMFYKVLNYVFVSFLVGFGISIKMSYNIPRGYNQTVVTVTTQQIEFGHQSVQMECPKCHSLIMTRTESKASNKAWLYACIICALG